MQEFQLLGFPKITLKNVLLALNDLRGDYLRVDNNTFRFAATNNTYGGSTTI